ncbi:MAG: integral rane sensor signal transduction histidine kinase [Candidatus Sulfotelmatobacter sp.]|nr:integral rane sensor signal transduction histidine kinase [Candidatus Sulfotelmatobacter sp.]
MMNTRSLRFRITAWYAGLLAGTLMVFGASVYLGLERYLDWTLQRTLVAECRTIATQLLSQLPAKDTAWLATEIDEAYAPEVNGLFIRVVHQNTGVVYLSGTPKDGTFEPWQIPFPRDKEMDGARKLQFESGNRLLINSMTVVTPAGNRFTVESGAPYHQIEVVLHGLLLTLAIYMPFVVSLAVAGGYWLMRRSLQPVDEITKRAEGITSTNLSERLPVIRSGDELERLSMSLNRMIERLDNAFEHINRFSADASHELRTPLTILQLELEGIAQNHRWDGALGDQIGSALEETHRMSRIVESLLAISRLDAGEVKMDKARLDLGELAASTAAEMKLLAEEKSIGLHVHAETGVHVVGDRVRLQQIIVNLIDNSIKYTQVGGKIELRVGEEGNNAVLEVSDNGLGIPAHALPHVFERFYRADKARSRATGGAGLGLSIVKAICAAHNADIKVSSQEGRGSSFRVELPLMPVFADDGASAALREI